MRLVMLAACLLAGTSGWAMAQQAPSPVAKWQGLYLGGDGGAMIGRGEVTGVTFPTDANTFGENGVVGAFGGYNWQNGPWVLGAEADWSRVPRASGEDVFTLRGRAGYATGDSLLYATVGAGTQSRTLTFIPTGEAVTRRYTGVVVGGGYELMLPNRFSFRAEGLYFAPGKQQYDFSGFGTVPNFSDNFVFHETILHVGLGYHFQ